MLTTEERSEFERTGLVRLPGAIDADDAAAMAERVWAFLGERDGIRPGEPETWTVPRPRRFKELQRSGAMSAIGSPGVRRALDEMLGKDAWREPEHWGQMLVSFPGEGRWRLPHSMWHLDMPAAGSKARLRAVQIFALLTPVTSKGGATLAVAGSNRIAQRVVDNARGVPTVDSADVRRILARTEPWFRALWTADEDAERERRFMEDATTIGGVEVRVVEMTGEAGDVILMDPSLLHTAAPHTCGGPRFVVTVHVFGN